MIDHYLRGEAAPLERREFLKSSLALAVGGGVLGQTATRLHAAEKSAETLPIIDSHQHLWDLSKFKLPWITPDSPLNRNYLMSDYLEAAKGLNIVKTIYMEVDIAPEQRFAEADDIAERCKREEGLLRAAVIGGRPEADDFAMAIERWKGNPYVKGVRRVLHGQTPAGLCLEKTFVANMRRLGEWNLSFDLCLRQADLPDAAKMIQQCPDTRFVLDHCGNPNLQGDVTQRDAWRRGLADVAKQKNAVCKVSGFLFTAELGKWTLDDVARVVSAVYEEFGEDRVLFGGDWPVCTKTVTLRQWVEALQAVTKDRPESVRRKLFADNATKHYRLG